jgi:hypothetical protein
MHAHFYKAVRSQHGQNRGCGALVHGISHLYGEQDQVKKGLTNAEIRKCCAPNGFPIKKDAQEKPGHTVPPQPPRRKEVRCH